MNKKPRFQVDRGCLMEAPYHPRNDCVENPTKFKVMDVLCGGGKTTEVINQISKSHKKQPFMYISVLIDECHRIAGTYYEEDDVYKRPVKAESINLNGEEYWGYDVDSKHPLKTRNFRHPEYLGGTKTDSLEWLLENKHNISSTHQLFLNMSKEMLTNAKDYILIIDEQLDVIHNYDGLDGRETKALFKKGILSLADDGLTLNFNREAFGRGETSVKDTRYQELAELCDLGRLACINNTFVVWQLDIELLLSFKEVWIATYMFDKSVMAQYLASHNISWETKTWGKTPQDIRHLINIVGVDDITSYDSMVRSRHHKLNKVSSQYHHLSTNHFKRGGKELVEVCRKNLRTYLYTNCEVKKGDYIYTTLKEYSRKIGGSRYVNSWVAMRCKATNQYSKVHNLAYMHNLYCPPHHQNYFDLRGYPVSGDDYSLSELVQWVWRSAIRNGEEINLYIPSMRMRELFICWLNGWDYYGKVGKHWETT